MAERSEQREADALRDRCEREDLVMFVNACFAATGQNEYYSDRYRQSVSIAFLHQYVLINYRRLYARALAAGINHFNQATIVLNLLAAGAPADQQQRAEEGRLIAASLWSLPANRVFALFAELRRLKVNNRRTRAVVKAYLRRRREAPFDAVKYRKKYRVAVAHAHVAVGREFTRFLFDGNWRSAFETQLFESYRRACYTQQALYDLPFTVAESFARKHNVPDDVFFKKIQPRMTAGEKLRYQNSVNRSTGGKVQLDLDRASLTRLAIYILSLPLNERKERSAEFHTALQTAARRALRRSPLKLGRVVAILDCSRSTWGTREKRRRPLAVAPRV